MQGHFRIDACYVRERYWDERERSLVNRWRPPAALRWSAAAHAGAGAAWLAWPGLWPYWLGSLALNHAVLATAGLLPRSTLLGPNTTRLPAAAAARAQVALTFDDGPHPQHTPRVLDMLDAAGARASFFGIGTQVERHARLAREIIQRGHSIENHTDSHPVLFATYGPRRMAREVAQAQDRIAQVTGCAPRFFRAVAGLRNPFLDRVLHQQGLQLVHWSRRGLDTNTPSADKVLARLTRGLAAGDILLMHDGHSAATPSGPPVALVVLPQLLARLQAAGLHSVSLTTALPLPAVGASVSP